MRLYQQEALGAASRWPLRSSCRRGGAADAYNCPGINEPKTPDEAHRDDAVWPKLTVSVGIVQRSNSNISVLPRGSIIEPAS